MKTLNAFLKKSAAAGLALLLSAPAGAVGPTLTQIGVAGAVSGKVFAFPQNQAKPVGREVASGKPLFLNEKVTTDAKGHMQIMLLDETTFTLGPNASMVLDEFVYDPATGAGKVTASVAKGAFRFITGRVAAKDPSQMKVKFPTGTMGIRGTIVAGKVGADGSATAILLGPGAHNNGGERAGSFELSNDGGSVDVTQPGFGSTLGAGDAPPTEPGLVPPGTMGEIMGELAPPEGGADSGGGGAGGGTGGGGDTAAGGDTSSGGDTAGGDAATDGDTGGESAGSLAGEDTMGGLDDMADTTVIGDITDTAGAVTDTASADSGDTAVTGGELILDGTSTWEDIQTVQTGLGYFAGAGPFDLANCSGGACLTPMGFTGFFLVLDFGAQTYEAGSFFWATHGGDNASPGPTLVQDSLKVAKASYAGFVGSAIIQGVSDSGYFSSDFSLANSNGNAAAGVDVNSAFDDTLGLTGLGFGTEGGFGVMMDGSGALSASQIGVIGESTWEAVQAIPSGVGVFSGAGSLNLTQCTGLPCVDPVGIFAYLLRVDFGAQVFGGGESAISYTAEDAGTGTFIGGGLSIPETSYSGNSGTPLMTASDAVSNIDFTLLDVDGVTAGGLLASFTFDDSVTMGNGFSVAANMPSNALTSQWSGIQAITSGGGYFRGGGPFLLDYCSDGPCVSPTGSFEYSVFIDFANQTFGGHGSAATLTASDPDVGTYVSDSIDITQQSYFGSSGNAAYTGWYYGSDSDYFYMDFTLRDVDGMPGKGLFAQAFYDDYADFYTTGYGASYVEHLPVSDWAGVQAIGSGTGWFQGSGPLTLGYCNGGLCGTSIGGFHYGLLIDFAGMTYGGGSSGVGAWGRNFAGTWSFSDSIAIPVSPATDYSGNSGPAVFSVTSPSTFLTADFTLKDVSGVAAGGLEVTAKYYDGGSWTYGYGHSSSDLGSVPSILDGAASWADLLTVQTGAGSFGGQAPFTLTTCSGGACTAPEGFFTYMIDVDFVTQRIFGGAFVKARDEGTLTSIQDSVRFLSTDFSAMSGAAGGTAVSESGNFTVDFSLNNLGGVAGAGLDMSASYDDSLMSPGSETIGSGLIIGGPRAGLGVADWLDVQALAGTGGAGTYAGRGAFVLTSCGGWVCPDPGGYFEYVMHVDFANQTFGGYGSGATLRATSPAGLGPAVNIQETLEIPVATDYSGMGAGNASFVQWSTDGKFGVTWTLRDLDSVGAAGIDANAYYDDFGGTTGYGWSYAPMEGHSFFSAVQALGGAGGQAGYFRGRGDFILHNCGGSPCTGPVGSFDYAVLVDFNNQTFGGGGSMGWFYANDFGTGVAAADSLVIPGGDYSGAIGSDPGASPAIWSPSGNLRMVFSFRDVGGDAAMGLDAAAFYDDFGGIAGAGFSYASRQNVSDWTAINALSGKGYFSGAGGFNLVQCGGSNCTNFGPFDYGFFRYGLLVDFDAQTIGGGPSGASVSAYEDAWGTSIMDTVFFPQKDFSSLSGPAVFNLMSPSGNLTVDFSLKDVSGVAALAAEVSAAFDDGSGNIAYGHLSDGQTAPPTLTTADGPADWSDILTIPGGTGQYASGAQPFVLTTCEGGVCNGDVPSTFDFTLDVNFGARTYTLNSTMSADDTALSGPISAVIADAPVDFSVLAPGAATIHGDDLAGYTVDVTLKNVGGVAGAAADATATLADTVNFNDGSGSVTDVPLVMDPGTVSPPLGGGF